MAPPDTALAPPRGKTDNGAITVAKVEEKFDAEDAADLRSWLQSIGTAQDIQVRVIRKAPRVHQGISIEGSLDTVNEFVDEDYIKDRWGGGLFQLTVMKRAKNGSMQYAAGRTIRIAGLPKMDDYIASGQLPGMVGTPETGGAVSQAMAMTQRMLEREQERAERASRAGSGMDPMILQAIVGPMQAQTEAAARQAIELQRTIAEKDARMMEIIARPAPKDDGFKDLLLGKMFDGENARISSLREQHASELRAVREGVNQDIKRERDRADDALKSLEKRHERELDNMKQAHKQAMESKDLGHTMRVESLQSEIKRLEREITAKDKELSELRAKKEKSFIDSAKEIVALQSTLKDIGIGNDDDDDDDEDDGKPWYQKLARTVVENPEAVGQFIGGVRASASGQPMPQQALAGAQQMQAQLPPNHAQALAAKKQRARARRAAALAASPAQQAAAAEAGVSAAAVAPPAGITHAPPVVETPVGDMVRPPDAQELSLAIGFMEAAIAADTEPEMFAMGAKDAIPTGVLNYIAQIGVDEFLASHVELGPESPLRGLRGRNFARQVFAILTATPG